MNKHFITGYNFRYSICEDGNVIRHYLINNLGEKVYSDKTMNKYIPNKSVNYSVCLSKDGSKHGRDVLMSKLMIEYFNLETPDDVHTYKLSFKNGDKSNFHLNNIYFSLDIKKDYPFNIIVFHNERDVVSKCCGSCGEKKDIKDFKISKRGFYLHECKTCLRKFNNKASRVTSHKKARKDVKDFYLNRLIRRTGQDPKLYTKEMMDIKRYTILIQRVINRN